MLKSDTYQLQTTTTYIISMSLITSFCWPWYQVSFIHSLLPLLPPSRNPFSTLSRSIQDTDKSLIKCQVCSPCNICCQSWNPRPLWYLLVVAAIFNQCLDKKITFNKFAVSYCVARDQHTLCHSYVIKDHVAVCKDTTSTSATPNYCHFDATGKEHWRALEERHRPRKRPTMSVFTLTSQWPLKTFLCPLIAE